MKTEVLDALGDLLPGSLLLMEPRGTLDAAVVAITFDDELRPRAVYSQHVASLLLAKHTEGMTYDDAAEWFTFNVGNEVQWLEDIYADFDADDYNPQSTDDEDGAFAKLLD